jgi:acyl transferase domain-containing protein
MSRWPSSGWGAACRGADDPDRFGAFSGRDRRDHGSAPDRWKIEEVFDPDPDAPGKTTRDGAVSPFRRWLRSAVLRHRASRAIDMDQRQRILLEVAWEALENAGQAPDLLAETKTGVYVGVCSTDYALFSPWSGEGSRVTPYSASGIAHSVVSGRLSYILGLRGPAITVDTACSSSLVALHLACQGLRMRDCRMAIAGGVHLMLAPDNTIAFCRTKMMSPAKCKTFAAAADGFVLGKGAASSCSKRLWTVADGTACCRHPGTAANQDRASGGLTVPNGPSQEAVIRGRWETPAFRRSDRVRGGPRHRHHAGDSIEVRAERGAGEGRAPRHPDHRVGENQPRPPRGRRRG